MKFSNAAGRTVAALRTAGTLFTVATAVIRYSLSIAETVNVLLNILPQISADHLFL